GRAVSTRTPPAAGGRRRSARCAPHRSNPGWPPPPGRCGPPGSARWAARPGHAFSAPSWRGGRPRRGGGPPPRGTGTCTTGGAPPGGGAPAALGAGARARGAPPAAGPPRPATHGGDRPRQVLRPPRQQAAGQEPRPAGAVAQPPEPLVADVGRGAVEGQDPPP